VFEEYIAKTQKSKALYERARKVLPGGVSYGIRYFDPYPFYTARARGSKLYDVDGNEYVDFWLGHTTHILGHSPPTVVRAVREQLENGTHYGTCHEPEIKLAEKVVKMVPDAEMVRFTNSGTEANMYAIRLARAFTGRSKIAKFEGGWHGGYDALHVAVKYPFDIAESAGLAPGAVQDTVVLPFNDIDGVKKKLENTDVASITIEPLMGSGGGIPADKEFLKELRDFTSRRGMLLIFDEVITGFRLAPGGGQQYFHVKPDITVFGKILGGGFPVGAVCGSAEIMEKMDTHLYQRTEFAFQGGTFTANPVTMTAGLATLTQLEDCRLIDRLNSLGDKTRKKLMEIFASNGVEAQCVGAGSLLGVVFTREPVKDPNSAFKADRKKLLNYHLKLIEKGVFFLPTHVGALCSEHSEADMEKLFDETENFVHSR
jgi:glutamate-1-semialdehyde 2,1-aminomutase